MWYWINFAIKSALFYGGWLYCIESVVECAPWKGALVIAVIMAYLFIVSNNRLADLLLVVTLAAMGMITDSLYGITGMIIYNCPYRAVPWLAPYWLISLWMLFGALIREGFHWLYGRWFMAALLGGAGGVSSYLASMELGAAQFGVSKQIGIAVLAIVWAAVVPFCIWYAHWLELKTKK